MRTPLLTTLLVVLFLNSQAQRIFKPGKIEMEILQSTCPYDSSAGAFVILDYGTTGIDHKYDVTLERYVRIKILSSSEFDQADITIPYFRNGRVERLKAFTYNIEDGEIVTSKVEKSDIFEENVEEDLYEMKFTFPDVREGSVIEYSYSVNRGNYYRLNTWYFQRSIPVLHSEYHVRLPEYFNYHRIMTGNVALQKGDINKESGVIGSETTLINHHHYLAKDVEAFKTEPYVTTREDFISKIDFELKSVIIPGVVHETILPDTYRQLSQGLYKDDLYSKDLVKAGYASEDIIALIANAETDLEKAQLIFDHIKSFEKADKKSSNLRSVFKNQSGTDVELNRMLIAALNEAGLNAQAVLISTRTNGKLKPYFPMFSKFNFTIAKLQLGDDIYLLDASEKDNLFGVLPEYCLNGRGLVIKEFGEEWVNLIPYSDSGTTSQATLTLSEDGVLTGDIKVVRKGYVAWEFQKDMEETGKEEYFKNMEENKSKWSIQEHLFDKQPDNAISNQESISLDIEGHVEDLGNVLYLNPHVYGNMTENPFKTVDRKYPVNFGSPFADMYITQIDLPEGFVVESLPESIRVGTPDQSAVLIYSFNSIGNKIIINRQLKIKKIEYSSQEYPYLRELYALMVARNGEQIVLKRQ